MTPPVAPPSAAASPTPTDAAPEDDASKDVAPADIASKDDVVSADVTSAETEGNPSADGGEQGTRTVVVKAYPHGARIGYQGRQIGTNTAEVEVEAGKRKALEVGLDGHSTRRLVVDGSKPEVTIVLKPKKP